MIISVGSVTQTLKKLIRNALLENGVEEDEFQTSAAPPDAAFDTGRFISVYLFHVIESPEFKNLPTFGGTGRVPVQHTPMGLILQYIVTVVAPTPEDGVDNETITQQRLTGFVARAIHDYPVINDDTQIEIDPVIDPDPIILHPELRGTGAVLRFNMRPASMEETINFWSAQDETVPRLSLFVEARVVVLEPKPPQVAPGIVLSVGQFVFPSADPQVIRSRSATWFVAPVPPLPAPPTARAANASPARVALFDAEGSANFNALINRPDVLNVARLHENNRLTLEVTGLGPGRRVLYLRSPLSTIRVALDNVAPANGDWEITVTNTTVSLRVYEQVTDVDGAVQTIIPASYGARVVVFDDRIGDTPRPRSSNEVPLTIVPQLLRPETLAGDLYRLTLMTASLRPELDPEDPPASEVTLSVGGHPLKLTEGFQTAPGPGEFTIMFNGTLSAPLPTAVIEFRLPLTEPGNPSSPPIAPTPNEPFAIRLVADGATATPEWLEAPP